MNHDNAAGPVFVAPRRICSTDELRAIVERVGWAPNLEPLFGSPGLPPAVEEVFRRSEVPQAAITFPFHGWIVKWGRTKTDVRGVSSFAYSVNVYVQPMQTERRICELVLDGFRRFLEHELREGFMLGDERPFDPHRGEV
jgi:hypothetical protein